MVITWYGEGCFRIQDADAVILIDPVSSETGLTPPRFKADVVLKTLNPFPPSERPEGEGYFITGAGEYNFKNINITGFPIKKESTEKFLKAAYLAEIEGVKLCFLGHISEMPEPAILEYLEGVDILFIPASGNPFIGQQAAVKLIKHLQPKIVVPSFFKIPGLKRKTDDIRVFLEEFNHKKIEPQEKLSIKRKELAEIKSTQIAVLKI
jgi:L-ascorbate metabolism protein UlaG (beta-lactamase superfamily)